MKRCKFADEQIAFALKQAEVGTPVNEEYRHMGIADATLYNWRKKYGAWSLYAAGAGRSRPDLPLPSMADILNVLWQRTHLQGDGSPGL